MISRTMPNLLAWKTESAVQLLEAEGLAVSIVTTGPPRIQTDLSGSSRVIRQRLIGSRLVELVVANPVSGQRFGIKE